MGEAIPASTCVFRSPFPCVLFTLLDSLWVALLLREAGRRAPARRCNRADYPGCGLRQKRPAARRCLLHLSRVVHRVELRRTCALFATQSAERLLTFRVDLSILARLLCHLRNYACAETIQLWRSLDAGRLGIELRIGVRHTRAIRADHRPSERVDEFA